MENSTSLRFQKIATISVFLLINQLTAQTFNGQGGLPIPPGAPALTQGTTSSPCTVSGVGTLGGGSCAQIANVTIDLLHSWVGDIAIFLVGPGGQVLEFSSGNGGAGDNFTNTVFSDGAPTFITAGSPPYTGNFRPEGRQTNTSPPFPNGNPLGTFTFANTFNGTNADGVWSLLINDYVPLDVGVVNSWSITFSNGGGSSNMVSVAVSPSPVCQGTPGTATLTLNFSAPTPSGTNYDVVFSATPGGNLTFNDIVPTGLVWTASIPIPAATTTFTLTSILANVGCQPIISAPTSAVLTVLPSPVAIISGDLTICTGQSTTLTASGGDTYVWSNGANTASISVPAANQSYSVTVTNANNCTATVTTIVQILLPPSVSLTAAPSICSGNCLTVTANLTGTPPFSFYFEFQLNGEFAGPGFVVNSSNNTVQFPACPPLAAGPTEVVICTLSDQNCSL